jgi:phosphoglucomutase
MDRIRDVRIKLGVDPLGGAGIAASGWFAARPSGTEDVYKIYAESFRDRDHQYRIQEEAQLIVGAVFRRLEWRARSQVAQE